MIRKKTLKRLSIGMLAAMSVLLPAVAHADYTRCEPYNSVYQECYRYERSWTEEEGYGEYVIVDSWLEPYPNQWPTIDP